MTRATENGASAEPVSMAAWQAAIAAVADNIDEEGITASDLVRIVADSLGVTRPGVEHYLAEAAQ